MTQSGSNSKSSHRLIAKATLVLAMFASIPAFAQDRGASGRDTHLYPGNLAISRSVYDNHPANVTVGEILPPNCASTLGGCAPLNRRD